MPTKAGRFSAWFVALFFLALTAIGLLTAGNYGQPWDEPWEQDILRMNGNQYAQTLGLETRFALTSTMKAPASGLIEDSVERDHGECAYYPLLSVMAGSSLSQQSLMQLWHAYTWLWFVAGAGALWLICRRLGLSRALSTVAVLFWVLTPRMFAEGHYNNKDLVLLSLVLITLWLSLRLMERPGVLRALLFSLAGAAATNTKVIGLFIWALCALFVLIRLCVGRRMKGRAWLAALVALVSFAGFYALLTPALWPDPKAYLVYTCNNAVHFGRWQNLILFRGAVFNLRVDTLPWYYLPYMIAVTTPLWLLALFAIGQVLALGRILRARPGVFTSDITTGLLLCTLLWLVPFLYAILGHPNLYNGWRHFYFLYGPMLALAGYGAGRIFNRLSALRSPVMRRVCAGLLALCMALTGTQIALSHPTEYTYYNALVAGKDVPEYLELDYWNVSVLQTVRKLLNQQPDGSVLTLQGAEYWSQTGLQSAWQLLTPEEQARITVLPADDPSAAYVLSNRTYAVLGNWQPDPTQQAVAQTDSFGLPLCTIYTAAHPHGSLPTPVASAAGEVLPA